MGPAAPRRLLVVAVTSVVSVALLAAALAWFRFHGDHARVAADGSGRQTIEYHDVRVDIPSSWRRLDLSTYEFRFERWGPPDASPCRNGEGVSFYASATFDPAHGPGVDRTTGSFKGWGGYTDAGEYAVYASSRDRDVVRRILSSARVRR